MATKTITAQVQRLCTAKIESNGREYLNFSFYMFLDLCADIIPNQDWQAMHESITLSCDGRKTLVKIRNLTTLDVTSAPLFQYLTTDSKLVMGK